MMQTFNGQQYLRLALSSLSETCDGIAVLDDGSTDDTPKIIREFPKVHIVKTLPQKTQEWTRPDDELRNEMLRMADQVRPDWCCSLDDDEEFEDPADVRGFLLKAGADVQAVAFGIAHLWDKPEMARTSYVKNGQYQSRVRAWRWREGMMVHKRRFHCGSGPPTAYVQRLGLRIIHWGYIDAAVRRAKYEMYCRLDPGGKDNGGSYEGLISDAYVEPFVRKKR